MANVKVAVRARPLLKREIDSQSPIVLEMRGQSTILFKTESAVAVGETRDASKEFVYDHSYWSVNNNDTHFVTQEQIYSDLGRNVLDSAFEGYNACIFAYGQTGSGKTYTMMGNESSPGLIPRICEGLFTGMKKKNIGQVSYKVEVSYMEIYNEKVRDLLKAPLITKTPPSSQGSHNLKVREHPKDGPYVENLSKHQVSDYQAIEELIAIGNSHRATASTKMNDVSSRSHAIFTLTFMQAKYIHGIPSETVSKIHMVDLAGSERASQTGAEGQRLKEGSSINKSLVCLGNVIQALADMSTTHPSKRKLRYIPYRDSVLTWLLKDSLGGNSKTIMIATISPCAYSYAETLSTLRYANRAKNIVNKPKVNEDENVKLIRELREEIRRLKDIIARGDFTAIPPENSLQLAVQLHNTEERVASLTTKWAEKWDNIQKIMEEHDLALRSEGVKMTVASEQPHLLGVDEDRFSAGVVLYYLKNGDTTIGHVNSNLVNDIALRSKDIAEMHCKIVLFDDMAHLHRLDGVCYVNQLEVEPDTPVKLSHGDTVRLGHGCYFRFNNPQEAHKLRESSVETDKSFNSSSVWSPFQNSASSFQYDKVVQLEQERDALRQSQINIEKEYEDKIRDVLEKLKKEEEDKAALQQELERLREEKINASLRLSDPFVASTPLSVSAPPERFLLPTIPSPTPSESDGSLTFDPASEREVTGEEHWVSSPLAIKEDYPHVEKKRRNTISCGSIDINLVRELSVSFCDNGDVEINRSDWKKPGGSQEDDYVLLETDAPQQESSGSNDSQQNKADMLRLMAEQERDELKIQYEERLKREAEEKERMRKELFDVEFKYQRSAKEVRRRSAAFSGTETDLDRSLPLYHSHRASRIKVEIPAYYMRGTGWSSYHVFEIQLKVGREEWTVYRKYEQFKTFHAEVIIRYPEFSSLILPPSKWFGVKNEAFVSERKFKLETYLKAFMAIAVTVSKCPLAEVNGKKVNMETVRNFHWFFRPGPLQYVWIES